MLGQVCALIPVLFFLVSIAQAQELQTKEAQKVEAQNIWMDPQGFHADLKAGFGYSTNPYSVRSEDKEAAGSFAFRIRPSLNLNATGKLAKFSTGADANSALFLGPSQKTRFMLVEGILFGRGEFNQNGTASMFAYGAVATTRNHFGSEIFLGSLTKISSDLQIGVSFRPADGVMTLSADAQAKRATYFDIDQPDQGKFTDDPGKLENDGLYLHGKLAWEFLKGKSAFLDARGGTWLGKDESLGVTVNPVWLRAGVSGLVAPNIKGILSAGYANALIRLIPSNVLLEGSSLAFLLEGDLNWRISEDSHLSLKFMRDLETAPIFLESYRNSLEADFRQKFATKFTFLFSPSFKWYELGKALADDKSARLAGNHRSDIILGMREELTYAVQDWCAVGLSHEGTFRWSNAKDLRAFIPEGKIADSSGSFVSMSTQNDLLLFARVNY